MTVREMFGLVLVLLLGLLLNRCAHLSAGQQVQFTRLPSFHWRVHRATGDVQRKHVKREVERALEQAAGQFENAMEEAGRSIEEAAEQVGEAWEEVGREKHLQQGLEEAAEEFEGVMEEAGRSIEEAAEEVGDVWEEMGREMDKTTDKDADERKVRTHSASTVYVLSLGSFAPQKMTVTDPPSHLALRWSDGEPAVRVEIAPGENNEEAAVVITKPREPTVSFDPPPERARIAVPSSISGLYLGQPYDLTLKGEPEKLEVRQHGRGEISLVRTGGTLVLSTNNWELTVEEAGGEVRMLDRRGRLLRSLAAGEEVPASESENARHSEGGNS